MKKFLILKLPTFFIILKAAVYCIRYSDDEVNQRSFLFRRGGKENFPPFPSLSRRRRSRPRLLLQIRKWGEIEISLSTVVAAAAAAVAAVGWVPIPHNFHPPPPPPPPPRRQTQFAWREKGKKLLSIGGHRRQSRVGSKCSSRNLTCAHV